MRRLFPLLLIGIAACGNDADSAVDSVVTPEAAVNELLAADSVFAQAAAQTDVAGALEAMFAADVVMPLPTGTFAEGREAALAAIRANPANEGARIEWSAARGGVSADGQHGFTFGYTTLHQADGTILPGKYLAYWVKQPEGWRVAVFRRGAREDGPVPASMMAPALPPEMVAVDASQHARYSASLDSVERAFSDDAQRIGLGPAFRQYGSVDAVNMGGRRSTWVLSADSIAAGFPDEGPTSPVSWGPERVIVAGSGDLGVTIGYIRDNADANARFPFFTIWRRPTPQDPWRYVAE